VTAPERERDNAIRNHYLKASKEIAKAR